MENALYIGLSKQIVLQTQMDMVANNVANINTPGYRAQDLLFKEYMTDPKGQVPPYSLVGSYGQFTNVTPGPVHVTGAPLDVALNGPGFFEIATPAGPRYTRAGSFTLNQASTIVTPSGDVVSAGGGSGITIPEDATEITIDELGNVSTQNGVVGRLSIVEFSSTDQLIREGNGLYRAPDGTQPAPAQNTRARQGAIENSNVQGVTEMTRMIEILREYQSIQRMIQSEHDLQRSAIQKLTTRN